MKKKTILLLLVFILALAMGCTAVQPVQNSPQERASEQTAKQAATYENISADQLKEMLEKNDLQLIDVREPDEYQAGYIKGAVLIPLGELEQRLQEISKEKPVVVYCRSGRRSAEAAEILIRNGYKQVYNIQGGILDWNYGLEKPLKISNTAFYNIAA
ncbi:MAG: rhodanese-like domain-containing protein [Bacillota bacterium]